MFFDISKVEWFFAFGIISVEKNNNRRRQREKNNKTGSWQGL